MSEKKWYMRNKAGIETVMTHSEVIQKIHDMEVTSEYFLRGGDNEHWRPMITVPDFFDAIKKATGPSESSKVIDSMMENEKTVFTSATKKKV